MGNQPDYTQFLQIPRSFVKIRGDSFCTTMGEQNTPPLKRNLSQTPSSPLSNYDELPHYALM